MKAAFAILLLTLPALAQDAPAPAPAPEAPAPAPNEGLRTGLTLVDLDAREAFLEGLLEDARRSEERCLELTTWLTEVAAGKDELAWTARLALRELERHRSLDPVLDLLVEGGDLDVLFLGPDAGDEGLDVTLRAEVSGADGDLDAWMTGVVDRVNRFPVSNLHALGDCTLELRMGADWASLRILEAPEPKADGATPTPGSQQWSTRVREYQGRSLAEIVGRNPDLVGLLPFEVPGVVASPQGPRTDILGVHVGPVSPEVCQFLGLEAGCGLQVDRVEPGTVAEVLGIGPGSVVLEVCGTEVRGQNGIKEAMGGAREKHPACGLCVVWVDSFGRRHQRVWKGGEAPEPSVPEQPAEVAPGLRPVGR